MKATLGDIITSYGKFSNKDEVAADYIIMGPGFDSQNDSQAKAGYLISISQNRKDCVSLIGPHKGDLVGITNSTNQTDNLIKYFSSLSSSSYAIFDSGYKYTYDRFNNKFRYIPTNADIAGLMVRTNLVAYPWFSPAGQQRGIINNAIKLAYTPIKHKETSFILRGSMPLSLNLESVHYSSVIRLLSVMHLHSIELTFVACSSLLSKHCRKQQRHNSLNSTMN